MRAILAIGLTELSRRSRHGALACSKTILMVTISSLGLAVVVVDRSSYLDSIFVFLRNELSGL
jgi:hypothetical protein